MAVILRLVCFMVAILGAAPVWAQEQVYVGVYVNDLPHVDLATNSYTLDAFVWFRWQDPSLNPAASMEFMNPFEGWGSSAKAVFDAPQQLDDGSYYQSVRYQGRFSSPMPVRQYPFDGQTLVLVMEDSHANIDEQVYLPDVEAVVVNPQLGLSDYQIGTPRMQISAQTYATRFGDTSLTGPETYSRATVSIPLDRPSVTYGIKVLFPILIILACASLALWLHPAHSEARVGLVVTALLTLVAFQLTALPQVNYLIMMDWLFFLAYLFVLGTMVQVVRSHWIVRSKDEDLAVGTDRRVFFGMSVGIVLAGFVVLWSILGG